MEDYPSNSQTPASEPDKDIKKVISSTPSRRKQPLGARFKETFLSGVDSHSVFDYVFKDIIVPSIKNLFVDASTQAVERAIFGDSYRSRSSYRYNGGGSGTGSTPTNYGRYGQSSTPPWQRNATTTPRRDVSPEGRAQHNFDEIVLDNRGEADRVVEMLHEIHDQYQMVSVADLYALVGISAAYTDQNWGWTDLSGTRVMPIRGRQFVIDLPRPIPIK